MTEPTPRSAAPRISRVETAGRVRERARAMLAGIVPGAAAQGGFGMIVWVAPSDYAAAAKALGV